MTNVLLRGWRSRLCCCSGGAALARSASISLSQQRACLAVARMRHPRRRRHPVMRLHRDATSALPVGCLYVVLAVPSAAVRLKIAALVPQDISRAPAARNALRAQAESSARGVRAFARTAHQGASRHARARWGVNKYRQKARQWWHYRRCAQLVDSHYGTKAVYFARRAYRGGTAQLVASTACTRALPPSSPQQRETVCCSRRTLRRGALRTCPIPRSWSCASSCTWGKPSCSSRGICIARQLVLPGRSRHRKIFRPVWLVLF